MQKAVTFGIAAYNADKYLGKCLESFLCKDVLGEIEVLVINDGSSDHTEQLAMSYAEKYPETFRVITQDNKGHGGALNTAVREAKGKYFKAVDADDWVVTENLPQYIHSLRDTEVDIVINGYHTINLSTGKIQAFSVESAKCNVPISINDLAEIYPDISACCSFHGITYKTEFYREIGFMLTEKVFYEDNEYAIIPFFHAESAMLLPFYLYEYLIGNGEQSVAFHNQVKRIVHLETVIQNIISYREKHHWKTPGGKSYYYQKFPMVLVTYYAIAFVKNPDKKAGRQQGENFYQKIENSDPLLNRIVSHKIWLLRIFNRIHFPAVLYKKLMSTGLYKVIRNLWSK